jgi:uncharacterized protein (DUF302 family)
MMYGYKRQVKGSYEEVVPRVKADVKKEGFGIMTEIDVKKTIKEKLGADFDKLYYLGRLQPTVCLQGAQGGKGHRAVHALQCHCLRG